MKKFCGLQFETNEKVLTPYATTEKLVEKATTLISNGSYVCDIGTGSGNIVISLLDRHPRARAVALDISKDALRLAKTNADNHKVRDRIEFLWSNLFERVGNRKFDAILINPPYMTKEEFEEVETTCPPEVATDGKKGTNIMEKVIEMAPRYLKPRGYLVFESASNQKDFLLPLLEKRFRLVSVDYYDLSMIVVAQNLID